MGERGLDGKTSFVFLLIRRRLYFWWRKYEVTTIYAVLNLTLNIRFDMRCQVREGRGPLAEQLKVELLEVKFFSECDSGFLA